MIPANTIKTDSTSTSNVVYVGTANSIDVSDSAAMWSIKRITTSGADFVVENAAGEGTPLFKWSERTTLTYK